MSATQVHTETPEKFLVRNNTAGYVGVMEIDHRGEEKGLNIDPFGSRWMTHDEMVATARAPRDPADNPFVEQTYVKVDPETQRREEYKMAPLTLDPTADPYVPSLDRFVPTPDAPQEVVRPAVQTPARAPSPVDAPPSSGAQAPPLPSPDPPASPQGGPVPPVRTNVAPSRPPETPTASGSAPAADDGEKAASWTGPPERPGEVVAGSLNGSDEAAPSQEAAAQPTDHPGERFVPTAGQAVAAPQTPGQIEEHAEAVDPAIGEETGAAQPPAHSQPEGEYAQAEEVGSPDAPEQDNDATQNGG